MKKLFCCLLLICFSNLNAQKFELGKVSLNELEEKAHPKDTSAVAAILYNKAKTVFIYEEKKGFSVIHEYEFRIKIYKKEGLDWATKKVSYYIGYENINPDVASFSNGTTYNIENNEIVKTKLKSEGTFNNNVNKYWNVATITLPNVKVGSVIEYKYTIKSENVVKFPVFDFQYEIPVNYVEYKTEIPEFFIYKPLLNGFFKVKSSDKIVNGYQTYSNKYNQMVNLNYQQINTLFTAENVPPLKEESYVDNIENYTSSVHYELDKTRFPEVPEKYYSTTWEEVAKTIYKDDDFGKQLIDNTFLIPDVRIIIKDATTEIEKVNAIFKYVQKKMNWNEFRGYLVDKGVKKAYEDETGNVAEINFILISMLKYAGINANPVLISTIDNGIPIYPNRTVFNYVIVAAEIDNTKILLDASNKKTAVNILPFQTLNWTGRLIKQDSSSEEINLVPTTLSKEVNNMIAVIDSAGKISGKCKIQKTDYNALYFRENYADLNTDSYLEKLEKSYNGIEITDYTVENANLDLSKPVVENFSFTSNNHIEVIDNKMYLNPLLFFSINKNPFQQEKRELPIYYGYPSQEKCNINIQIPDGYAIESLPKSTTIATQENIFTFSYKIIQTENKIQIVTTKDINLALLSQEFYPNIKDFYQKVISAQNEKIVLKKL